MCPSTFPQVPPGRWLLGRVFESKQGEMTSWMTSPLEEVEVQPGQTLQVTLGANARPVTASIRLPAELRKDPGAQVFALVHTPFVQPPAEVRDDPAALQKWAQDPDVQAPYAQGPFLRHGRKPRRHLVGRRGAPW